MSRETEENIDERQEIADRASRYLGRPAALLTDRERAVFRRHLARRAIARDPNRSFDEKLTPGNVWRTKWPSSVARGPSS